MEAMLRCQSEDISGGTLSRVGYGKRSRLLLSSIACFDTWGQTQKKKRLDMNLNSRLGWGEVGWGGARAAGPAEGEDLEAWRHGVLSRNLGGGWETWSPRISIGSTGAAQGANLLDKPRPQPHLTTQCHTTHEPCQTLAQGKDTQEMYSAVHSAANSLQ